MKHFFCVLLALFVIASCGGGNKGGREELSEVEMLYSKELKIYEGKE